MGKFITKPIEVDAIRFLIPSGAQVTDGLKFLHWPVELDDEGYFLTIPVVQPDSKIAPSEYRVDVGDWIITEADGDRYPVTHENFLLTYVPVGDDIPGEPFTYADGHPLQATDGGNK